MKRIVVTGATGFVGPYMLSMRKVLPAPKQQVEVSDRQGLHDWFAHERPDAVVHMAAQSSVPQSFQDPLGTYEVNFLGTLNVLEALKSANFKGSFLHVGTGDLYGRVTSDDLPIHESHPLQPLSPYAVSKVAAEALCYQWSQDAAFKVVMTRSFNHIGPGQSTGFAVSSFAKQIALIAMGKQSPIIRAGDLEVSRDFTDVRDIVRAYWMLLKDGENGAVYNVCSGIERTLGSIIADMAMIANVSFDVEVDSSLLRPGQQPRAVGSPNKLRAATGWEPQIAFSETLRSVIHHWTETAR